MGGGLLKRAELTDGELRVKKRMSIKSSQHQVCNIFLPGSPEKSDNSQRKGDMHSLVILKEPYNAIPFSSVLQPKGLESDLISDGKEGAPLFTRSRVMLCEWLMGG